MSSQGGGTTTVTIGSIVLSVMEIATMMEEEVTAAGAATMKMASMVVARRRVAETLQAEASNHTSLRTVHHPRHLAQEAEEVAEARGHAPPIARRSGIRSQRRKTMTISTSGPSASQIESARRKFRKASTP